MTDLEWPPALPDDRLETPPAKCRRHVWIQIATDPAGVPVVKCKFCPAIRDETRARRGRTARKRGNAIQRQRITALGGRNLAGNNPNLDGLGLAFRYESKSGGAFSDRYWRWLAGIPVEAGQTPVLIVTEAPGPGHRARSYVVVPFDEWRLLHGEG